MREESLATPTTSLKPSPAIIRDRYFLRYIEDEPEKFPYRNSADESFFTLRMIVLMVLSFVLIGFALILWNGNLIYIGYGGRLSFSIQPSLLAAFVVISLWLCGSIYVVVYYLRKAHESQREANRVYKERMQLGEGLYEMESELISVIDENTVRSVENVSPGQNPILWEVYDEVLSAAKNSE